MEVTHANGIDAIFLNSTDADRIRDLAARLNVSEADAVSAALQWYEDTLNIADLWSELPNP
jgi:hypothetical protein